MALRNYSDCGRSYNWLVWSAVFHMDYCWHHSICGMFCCFNDLLDIGVDGHDSHAFIVFCGFNSSRSWFRLLNQANCLDCHCSSRTVWRILPRNASILNNYCICSLRLNVGNVIVCVLVRHRRWVDLSQVWTSSRVSYDILDWVVFIHERLGLLCGWVSRRGHSSDLIEG